MICVIYVDNTIIAGPDASAIDALIKDLGISNHEQRHVFQLRDEGEVGDFLGIRIEKLSQNKFYLSQPGLISKVIEATGMSNSNAVLTPSSTSPLGSDKGGSSHNENWDYASIIGMLMYLSMNSRPDIAYAVHSCARFAHAPTVNHSTAVKQVI